MYRKTIDPTEEYVSEMINFTTRTAFTLGSCYERPELHRLKIQPI